MAVTTPIDELWRDMRIAARSLRRSPAFAVAACATLSLGFALTTTMFALAKGVLLKPLPYRDPERLVFVWAAAPEKGITQEGISYRTYADWRNQAKSFSDLGIISTSEMVLTSAAEPRRTTL
jgi:hypothetical protein